MLNGIYIYTKPNFESIKKIEEIFIGCTQPIQFDKLHTTILTSEQSTEYESKIEHTEIKAKISSLEIWENQFGGILILRIDSKQINDLNISLLNKYNIKNSYDDYIPHITIFYSDKKYDVNKIIEIRKKIKDGIEIAFDKLITRKCIKQNSSKKLCSDTIFNNII